MSSVYFDPGSDSGVNGWDMEKDEEWRWTVAAYILRVFFFRNVAKMEDAEVKIDDGKEDGVVPDTLYQ